jgi:glucokinase
MTNDFVLAADVGGTHITAALIDMHARELVASSLVRKHVNADGAAAEIIQAWSECLTNAKGDVDVAKICLAMPGPFDYNNGISGMKDQGKFDALFEANIKELLADAMRVEAGHFFFENDAACFLQGEVFAGCAKGFEKVIGVTLGTGLGTAVYNNSRSHSADLWSLPFKSSIAEDYLSTRWFVQLYGELSGNFVSGVKEIADKTKSDPTARTVFAEFGKNLASFLQLFIEKEQPEAVVVAGNISQAYSLFGQTMEAELRLKTSSVQLKQSMLGEQAALLGAAGSWNSATQKKSSLVQ